jgi:hypothetical protein
MKKADKMKSIITGCVLSLVISTPLLAADGPMGPGRADWPPLGGVYARPPGNLAAYPGRPVGAPVSTGKAFPQGYMAPYNYRFQRPPREAPVLPPGGDWPGTAYGHADMAPPPQPGYPVQVVPPPGIPLEGDIMDTTVRPVRHWRPEGRQQ